MMKVNELKISIIVPVYNAERYLIQCLESLVNQTYKDIEILCINDGSTDSSQDILLSYSNRDSRIVVINKKNSGVSDTRNVGVKHASGAYVMFVDSDDWLELNTCQSAIDCAVSTKADIIMWSYISEGTNHATRKELFPGNICFEEEQVKDKIHRRFVGLINEELAHPELADSICPVWGKLYKRELIAQNKVSFIDLKRIGTYEDGLFNLEVSQYAKRVVYLNRCLYHYRREERQSVTSGYQENLYNQWQVLFRFIRKYIEENKLADIYFEALDNRIALSTVGLTLNIVRSDYSYITKIKMIRHFLKEECYQRAYDNLVLKYFPIHWKVFYICARFRIASAVFFLGTIIQKIISR